MKLVHILACAAMIPVLVVAERFSFGGGCESNLDNTVAPIAHTEQGLQRLVQFASGKLYLWNPMDRERDLVLSKVELTMSAALDTFSLTFKKKADTSPTTINGRFKYQFQPKMVIILNTTAVTTAYEGIFSFNNKGEADLYPLLITKTDLILRGCNGAFLGRMETLYVLSNQNYASLDTVCTRETIRTNFNWDVVVPAV